MGVGVGGVRESVVERGEARSDGAAQRVERGEARSDGAGCPGGEK